MQPYACVASGSGIKAASSRWASQTRPGYCVLAAGAALERNAARLFSINVMVEILRDDPQQMFFRGKQSKGKDR